MQKAKDKNNKSATSVSNGRSKHKHGSRRNISFISRTEKQNRLWAIGGVQDNNTKPRFSADRLKFLPMTGYEILKKKKKKQSFEFSQEAKAQAIMLYQCIRHLPGFIEKSFTNANDAVSYVYAQSAILIPTSWGFNKFGDDDKYGVNSDYNITIFHHEVDAGNGRWLDYSVLNDNYFLSHYEDRLYLMCCMNLIIHLLGFNIVDPWEGDGEMMGFSEWYDWERDCAFDQGEENDSSVEEHIDEIEELKYFYEYVVIPLQHQIKSLPIDFCIHYITRQNNNKYVSQVLRSWSGFILNAINSGFYVNNYITNCYERSVEEYLDENSLNPNTYYGFIYNGTSKYAERLEADVNDRYSNYNVFPFSLFSILCPKRGITYTTDMVNIGLIINKVFDIDLNSLK